MAGLTIVGLGPARPEMITVEAQGVLQCAQDAGWRTYGLAHAREVVASIAPDLYVRSLDYLYGIESVDRPAAYRDLGDMLVRRVQVDQLDVAYVVAGSPLFINDAVLRIRDLCEQASLPLRIVHGVSFLDLILDRVYWTGWTGLQMYSAWNIARDGMELNHNAPAILFQLGEFSAGGDALDESRSVGMLEEVRDHLMESYPPEHPVVILYSSGRPEYQSLSKAINLSSLAEVTVPVYSNLWVPALDGPSIERRMAPESA
jgi:uncharacterized protein YabN with tetrapyrrole methylase and pyrophosphatase domain